jgi:hypothetical protein
MLELLKLFFYASGRDWLFKEIVQQLASNSPTNRNEEQSPSLILIGQRIILAFFAKHFILFLVSFNSLTSEAKAQPLIRGVLITGGPGSGKTALILAMVERSCFGQLSVNRPAGK